MGKGESLSFSYHIIRFKYPVFNTKIVKFKEKQDSIANSQGKNNQQKCFLKQPGGRPTRQIL